MSSLERAQIVIGSEICDVTFRFHKGFPGSYFEPPEPPDAEIVDVFYKGINVNDIIQDWAEVERSVLELYFANKEAAAEEKGAALDEERKLKQLEGL